MAKTNIEVDAQGRRRRQSVQRMPVESPEEQFTRRIAILEKQVEMLIKALAGIMITGKGFSGSGPKGIKFNMPTGTFTLTIACSELDGGQVTVNGKVNF